MYDLLVQCCKKADNFSWQKCVHDTLKSQITARDATIPFFQIRSDPENSEYRPIPIRS